MFQSQRGPTTTLLAAAAVLIALTMLFGSRSTITTTTAHNKDENDDDDDTKNTNATTTIKRKDSNHDDIYSLSRDGILLLHHLERTTSTQDAARRLVTTLSRHEMLAKVAATATTKTTDIDNNHQASLLQAVAVTAVEQTAGRGTHGRDWIAVRGNCFVTIGIPTQAWSATGLPLTLLPIKIGLVVAHQVVVAAAQLAQGGGAAAAGQSTTTTTIKWPNDVLVNGDKIAGVLIESAADWFLIGIGVNVGHAPHVPTSGRNYGRKSTCIREHYPTKREQQLDDDDDDEHYVQLARQMGVSMASDLAQWLSRCCCTTTTSKWNAAAEQQIMLQQYRSFIDLKLPLVLRDSDDQHPVVPVDIEPDGRLRVARLDNGQERLVVSDYFF